MIFDEFVGEKVVSPPYSSAVLGPPLPSYHIRSYKKPKATFWPNTIFIYNVIQMPKCIRIILKIYLWYYVCQITVLLSLD